MNIETIPILRWVLVPYTPQPDNRPFMDRAQHQSQDEIEITVAVLDAAESQKFFGVRMARRGVQPVWVRIVNHGAEPYRLNLVGIDPNYYSAFEAAAANHFSNGKRLLGFGALAWVIFLPLLWLIPVRIFAARRSNRKIDEFFQEQAFRLSPVPPGQTQEGFVFTPLDAGMKSVRITLLGSSDTKEFEFEIPVPGLDADYMRHEFEHHDPGEQLVECDLDELRKRLAEAPAGTTNLSNTRPGDPANLVVVGEFETLISAFGARWDLTETITLATCAKTFRAFMTGWDYRYSPVSPLYLFGRSQDFALQRVRQSINERLHLRLWMTTLRYHGAPAWLGQVSRDIGVRFTWRTWNLTTHRIDPNVDEARDYVVEDLLQANRLELAGYVDGVGACTREAPRHNLTGDPYYTDGKRAAVVVSPTRTTPKFVAWS
jgi:hypothetical protein